MRRSDVRIGMRVTAEDASGLDTDSGVVLDIDPEEPGREFLVRWDIGVQTWIEAAALEREVTR